MKGLLSIAPELPYIHHIRPWSTVVQRLGYIVLFLFIGIYFWRIWELAVAGSLGTLAVLTWIAFTPTITFIVNRGGLTVLRRPIIRIGGTFDFFTPRDIRRIRYRLETIRDTANDGAVRRFFILDLVASDSRIVRFLNEETVSFDPELGKKLAAALNVPYEEYLDNP